ncbi:hypothetical protein TNCV_3300211 [Trichonephila clavipes]|nr:hypothetical protein TNCV_3300211 [Trichonephila clavipes]
MPAMVGYLNHWATAAPSSIQKKQRETTVQNLRREAKKVKQQEYQKQSEQYCRRGKEERTALDPTPWRS